MAITKLNSLAIPDDTIVEADLSYPLTNFSSTGIDDNASSTAVTIDSSQRVGIGTNSPTATSKVNIVGGNAGNLLVDNGGEQYTQILLQRGSTANTGGDILIDGTASEMKIRGLLAGDMIFATGPTAGGPIDRMRLSSSGTLLIGDSNNYANSALYVNNSITTNYSGTIGMRYNASGATNNYYKGISGTQVGLNQVARGLAIFNYDNDSNAGICFYPAAYPNISGNPDPSAKFTPAGNLQFAAGNGIDFSSSSSGATSEVLDDYEEGTWTPAIYGVTSGMTYTSSGWYTIIGDVCHVWFFFNMTVSSLVGSNIRFSIPVIGKSGMSQSYQGGHMMRTDALTAFNDSANFGIYNSQSLYLYNNSGGVLNAQTRFQTGILSGQFAYKIA